MFIADTFDGTMPSAGYPSGMLPLPAPAKRMDRTTCTPLTHSRTAIVIVCAKTHGKVKRIKHLQTVARHLR